MTVMAEAALARELAVCYCNVAVVTDWDAGIDVATGVTQPQVIRKFAAALGSLLEILLDTIAGLDEARTCYCARVLDRLDAPPLLDGAPRE
jgi:5'-methylthioadenosine phosphorylase